MKNTEIENIHKCPSKIWDKFSSEEKNVYNYAIEVLSYKSWTEGEDGIITDHKILAHNAIFQLLISKDLKFELQNQ